MKDDIGLGSVVGSTFFNVLLVPGVFALVVKEVLKLLNLTELFEFLL